MLDLSQEQQLHRLYISKIEICNEGHLKKLLNFAFRKQQIHLKKNQCNRCPEPLRNPCIFFVACRFIQFQWALSANMY